jgi:hypothetical protein
VLFLPRRTPIPPRGERCWLGSVARGKGESLPPITLPQGFQQSEGANKRFLQEIVYQPVVEETLPERFRNLFDALERGEMKSRLLPSEQIQSSGTSASR